LYLHQQTHLKLSLPYYRQQICPITNEVHPVPENSVFIGNGSHVQSLLLSRANRHGLIAGATGTGKTVTLQILAEGFSAQGVPVFMADVKGKSATPTNPNSCSFSTNHRTGYRRSPGIHTGRQGHAIDSGPDPDPTALLPPRAGHG